jgi:hypothetical protein
VKGGPPKGGGGRKGNGEVRSRARSSGGPMTKGMGEKEGWGSSSTHVQVEE